MRVSRSSGRQTGVGRRREQPVENVLCQIPAGWQHPGRLGGIDGLLCADVHHALRDGQVLRPEIDIAHGERAGRVREQWCPR